MLRTALRPASLGLLVVLLAAATLFTALGHWQLDRAHQRAAPLRTEHLVPLASVLAPAAPFTSRADQQLVSAAGSWVDADTVLVAGRPLHGRSGSYVVSALRVSPRGATAASRGALLPVVRGWVPEGTRASQVPEPPAGTVVVEGRLMVSEDPQGVAPGGSVRALSSADLINLWHPPLYTGYLLASSAPVPLLAVPAPAPSRHLDLQNLSYAFQWWLFAAFAIVFWGKTVKDRHAADLEALAEEAEWERSGAQLAEHGVSGGCEDEGVSVGAGAPTRAAPPALPTLPS